MKSRSQTGSAHVVIIIVLIVALLGAVGFVFWQNFLKPSNKQADNASLTSSKDAQGTSQSKLSDKDSQEISQPKLSINEWDVGGDYTGNGARLAYSIKGSSLIFTDSRLAGTECEGYGGSISRQTANEEAYNGNGATVKVAYDQGRSSDKFSPIGHVGDYYYTFMGQDVACPDESLAQIVNEEYDAWREVVKTLRAL